MPRAVVEVDWADPVAPFSGTDISEFHRSFSTNRGRSTELDQPQAGTATVVLDNRDGRFDPGNRSGAYYPNATPGGRMRISAMVDGGAAAFTMRGSANRQGDVIRGGEIEFPIFTGDIESIDQTWDPSNKDAVAEVTLVDAFGRLSGELFDYGMLYNAGTGDFSCGAGNDVVPSTGPPFIPDDTVGERILIVLDCIDWMDESDLDDGTVTILGSDQVFTGTTNIRLDNVDALSYLLSLADADGGWVYIDPLGRLRFIGGASAPVVDPSFVYGDVSGENRYRDLTYPLDTSRVFNQVTVTTTSPSLQGPITKEDARSIARFRHRPKTFTIPPVGEGLSGRVLRFLVRYRFPKSRIPALIIKPDNEGEWREFFRRNIADMIRVRKRPQTADQIERDVRIEGISVSSPEQADWTGTFQISDVAENMLTDDQSIPEDTVIGWAAETNCTVGVTGPAIFGGEALALTSSASGDMSARTTPDTQIQVEVGKRYRATAYFRSAVSPRSCRVEINWRDSGGANLSSSAGTSVADTTSGWTYAEVDAAAPASAVYATVRLTVLATGAASEVHRSELITLTRS